MLELIIVARIKSAVMLEHETFKLPGGYWYRFAGFYFLEWMAFCHVAPFRLEVAPCGGSYVLIIYLLLILCYNIE